MRHVLTLILAVAVALCAASASATPTTLVEPKPKPPAYALRIDMVGCGQKKAVSIATGKQVLLVNAGTAVRRVYSSQAPMPQWGLKKGMWLEVKASGVAAGTSFVIKITEKHVGCAKPGLFTITVLPL